MIERRSPTPSGIPMGPFGKYMYDHGERQLFIFLFELSHELHMMFVSLEDYFASRKNSKVLFSFV